MKKENKTYFRWSPGLIGMGIYVTIRIINGAFHGTRFFTGPITKTVVIVAAFIVISYIIIGLIHVLEKKVFNQERNFTRKRLLFETLWISLVCLIFLNLAIIFFEAISGMKLLPSNIVQANIIALFYYILYFTLHRGHYFISQYVDSLVRLQKIENDHLTSSLEALKAQYDSHFLFNSLNNIYFLMDDNVPKAKLTLEKLSELLRYHLYQDQEKMVTLEKDCEYLRTFIALNKVRKNKSLTVEEELIDSKVLVYPHLFVPLIENAFKYVDGATPRISISIKENSGIIYCEVTNSKRIMPSFHKKKGIGLKNLRKRLELLYQHGFRLTTQDNKDYFKASLVINTL